ncbi:MAG: hypothetical protein Q9220_005356 [cf. Caloplaca sp. 1 TL-2023]
MAPKKGSRRPGAPRAGGYHVKTGCITCKIRHVKCDEEKPECHKCTSTGRKCDGYASKQEILSTNSSLEQAIQTIRQEHLSFPFMTITDWRGSSDEQRGFEYFRVQTSEDLAYSLNNSLEELVLQTSHRYDAIKHGAIALGSLGETIRINSNSTLSEVQTPARRRHEFARAQYYKAISILNQDIAQRDKDMVDFALISCFLFIVFEFLQGNDQSAVTHLRGGLNLLRETYFPKGSPQATRNNDQQVPMSAMQKEIARIFHILDTQATMWLGLRTFHTDFHMPIDNEATRHVTPSTFASLDEACDDLNCIIGRIYNFRRMASKHDFAPSTAEVPASVYAERDQLLDRLDVHRRRLSNYLARRTTTQEPEDPHRITVLRINRKVTTMMLATYLEPHEDLYYAQTTSQFWQIVSLATLILRPETPDMHHHLIQAVQSNNAARHHGAFHEAPHERQIFAFFNGLIQPLYFTAIKCRDKSTAVRAIELLEMEPWREGAWDSKAMARIARRKMEELERKGWYDEEALDHRMLKAKEEEDRRYVLGEEALSTEWTLATDPPITYPV